MADKSPTSASDASLNSGDPQLHLKKRARRRLVGATALALLAVIALPMVMDQEARPPVQDIQIRIPSQDPSANVVTSRITTQPALHAAAPVPQPAPTLTAKAGAAQEPTASTAIASDHPAPETKPKTTPAAIAKTEPHTQPQPQPQPHAAAIEKTTEKPKADESVRAAALLNDEHWVIQLGAYQEHGNVKILQTKLKELGYPSYTEKIDTANGSRIRVRCGPFPSRAAAEKAQARLKKIGAGGPSGGTLSQSKS